MDEILPSIEACPHQKLVPFLLFHHRGESFIKFHYFWHVLETVNDSGSTINIMSIFLGFIAHTLQINDEKVVKDIEIYGLKVGWKIPEWWKYFDLILLPLT